MTFSYNLPELSSKTNSWKSSEPLLEVKASKNTYLLSKVRKGSTESEQF